jgi:hypothetical protein
MSSSGIISVVYELMEILNFLTTVIYSFTFDVCQKSALHIDHLMATLWMFSETHLGTIQFRLMVPVLLQDASLSILCGNTFVSECQFAQCCKILFPVSNSLFSAAQYKLFFLYLT